MTTARVARYTEQSQRVLRKARVHFLEGDMPQASEKGWGAVALTIKACAESRGMRHSRHGHLGQAVSRFIEETGDGELQDLFSYAESLHANCYESYMLPEKVDEYLGHAERLVAKLRLLREPTSVGR